MNPSDFPWWVSILAAVALAIVGAAAYAISRKKEAGSKGDTKPLIIILVLRGLFFISLALSLRFVIIGIVRLLKLG